jgi:hypothetical protein
MITEMHVFDFDGTLADSSHRYRQAENGKIDLQYWIDNEHRTLDDSPLPLLTDFIDMQTTSHIFPLIATARIWCELSVLWAQRHGITSSVIARKDRRDSRGGAELKIQGINRLLNLKQFQNVEKIHVYEDNADYLYAICDYYQNSVSHFIPSNQGH